MCVCVCVCVHVCVKERERICPEVGNNTGERYRSKNRTPARKTTSLEKKKKRIVITNFWFICTVINMRFSTYDSEHNTV